MCQGLRDNLRSQVLSEEAASIILNSWKMGTRKQYDTVFVKCQSYCSGRQISPTQTSVYVILDFLLQEFNKGCSYSLTATHRSALSRFLPKIEGHTVGEHPLVVHFMKGINNIRPPRPRYTTTWDSDVVIQFLKPFDHSTTKGLTLKLTIVLALLTAQ